MGFPGGSGVKESTCNAGGTGNTGSIPGSGRSSGGGHGNPLQYSCLENPMDRGVWRVTVHSMTKRWTQLKRLSMHVCDYNALGLRNTYHQIKMTSFITIHTGLLRSLGKITVACYIYIYTHTYIHIYTHTHIHIHIYTHTYVWVNTHTHIHVYVYTYTHIYIYVCVCVCMCLNFILFLKLILFYFFSCSGSSLLYTGFL